MNNFYFLLMCLFFVVFVLICVIIIIVDANKLMKTDTTKENTTKYMRKIRKQKLIRLKKIS